jgi:hypothetical protein
MEDNTPDQTDTHGGNGAWEESEGSVDGFAHRKFGIGKQNKNEGQADLPDNTRYHKINVVSEGFPENLVRDQGFVIGQSIEKGRVDRLAAFPLKKAEVNRSQQRYKNREDKQRHRNDQIKPDR